MQGLGGGGGEGGKGSTPLYKLYRYVPPHRLGFLLRSGLKTGIHFAHFGLESGMIFKGTTGLYERLYRFNTSIIALMSQGSSLLMSLVAIKPCAVLRTINRLGPQRFLTRFGRNLLLNLLQ